MTAIKQPLFYGLPATLLREGLSTSDGQDIIEVTSDKGHVYAIVYTPSDDSDEDDERRCAPETRIYSRAEIVGLAVFHNTPVDMSDHPQAEVAR